MKVSVLYSIARQVEGEYVLVDAVFAHANPDRVWRHVRTSQLPTTTERDGIPYVIHYGVIEDIEVSED